MPLIYQSQNDDEAVGRVEAGPGERHLRRYNIFGASDPQQPLFLILVWHNVQEARGNSTAL